ncbi:flippase [Luteibacter jiangsuensis]
MHATYRDAIATLVLRLSSLGVAFVASILFARSIGPSGYGFYSTIIAWTTLLIIPAALGMPEYFLRELASVAPREMSRAIAWADRRLVVMGTAAGLLLAVPWRLFPDHGSGFGFIAAAPIPLLAALTQVRQSALRQLGTSAAAVWPQALMLPLLILIFAAFTWMSVGLNVTALVVATTLAHACAFLVTDLKLRQRIRHVQTGAPIQRRDYRIGAALPFIGLAGLALLNTRVDILVLSTLSTSLETGVYSVATRIADVLLLPVTVVNLVISPAVARLHQAADRSKLQVLLTRSSRFALALTALPAAVLLLFADPIIEACFGDRYLGASTPLRILALAQILNASAGAVGMLLSMTGYEHSALRVGILSAILNLGLNVVLVPLFGGTGAAVGTAISLIAWRAGFYWVVRRRLGMRPTAFGV